MKNRLFLILFLVTLIFNISSAQKAAIKSNLLADVALSPNLGVEFKLAPRWTLGAEAEINGWNINGHRWRHWLVEPEVRYWLCDIFQGHFFGLHVLGGKYNFGNIKNGIDFLGSNFSELSHSRFQGWGVGAGLAYGYSWILSKHWNITAEIGIGWIYTRYDQYPCAVCGDRLAHDKPHNYVGPTKAAVELVYLF